MQNNPKEIDGISVIPLDTIDNKQSRILVAVADRYQEEVFRKLDELQFDNYQNAYKYTFLLNSCYEDEEVVNVKELFLKQYEQSAFNRYDIIVRLLAIENYYGKNDYGINLYKKMQNKSVESGYGEISIERFKKLIISWEENGYDAESEIIVDKNYKLIDGAHRLALAVYHNLSYIRIRFLSEASTCNYGEGWFRENLSDEEYELVSHRFHLLLNEFKEEESKNKIDKLKEEITILLGNSQEFGRGQFYQSLEELGIEGQRPTQKRIDKYKLENIVKGKRVFDIGCNCGFLDLAIGSWALSVTGVEYNNDLVKVANRVRNYLNSDNVRFLAENFIDYQVDNQYDVVFSFAVHYWIAMPIKEYCRKVMSLLSDGGTLIFESQDIEKDLKFEDYCKEFEQCGLKRVNKDMIFDDGKILRMFVVFTK